MPLTEVVARLNEGFRKAMDSPSFAKNLALTGQEPWGANAEALRKYMLGRIPVERELVARYRLREQQ